MKKPRIYKKKGQNYWKREACKAMLKKHPEWSNRRLAAAVKITISTDDKED